jgi:IclR family acetate operon transcriptional repressor
MATATRRRGKTATDAAPATHARESGRTRPDESEARPAATGSSVRLLERAMDLLECLEKNRAPMGVRALEASTGVPRATGPRLLDAFERRGYVQKDRGRYALAAGTVRLARSYLAGDSLVTLAAPVLQGLASLSGETCALYVRQGFDRLLVQHVESPRPLRHSTPIGERVPLHLGASGQILCCGMPEDLLEQYLESVAPAQLASGKVLSKKELLARCHKARLRGYAIAVDERFDGISAVAAPVMHNVRGVVAAINVAGPSSRMAEKLEQLSIDVRHAAHDVSEMLNRL